MPQTFTEGKLQFQFPDAWILCRPGKTTYFVNHFQHLAGGCAEMDFVAFDHNATLWLIEVKDYSRHLREKKGDVWDEIARKTRDVMAMICTSAIVDHSQSSATKPSLGVFGREARGAARIRVVLHCELSPRKSKLFPQAIDATHIQMKLRRALRSVDQNALVSSMSRPNDINWEVSRVRTVRYNRVI